MVLMCEVCGVEVSSFFAMNFHVQGRKHMQNQKMWDMKRQQADLAIYITGFPFRTTEDDIRECFQKFGPINKLSLPEQNNNRYSIIEFEKKESVQRVLSKTTHVINSVQVSVRPRSYKGNPYAPVKSMFVAAGQSGAAQQNLSAEKEKELVKYYHQDIEEKLQTCADE